AYRRAARAEYRVELHLSVPGRRVAGGTYGHADLAARGLARDGRAGVAGAVAGADFPASGDAVQPPGARCVLLRRHGSQDIARNSGRALSRNAALTSDRKSTRLNS